MLIRRLLVLLSDIMTHLLVCAWCYPTEEAWGYLSIGLLVSALFSMTIIKDEHGIRN